MGPRSDERGNDTPELPDREYVLLQWGRARMSAEMTAAEIEALEGAVSFNGAALG